jgi:ABC-type transport system substrate-binding protein
MAGVVFRALRPTESRWRFLAVLVAPGLIVLACSGDGAVPDTIAGAGQETVTSTGGQVTTTGAPARFDGQLAGLTVIDENTFTVELIEADPEFFLKLAIPPFYALPDSALEDPAAQNEMPIGNGPFMMAGPWEHGVRISAVRNPDYQLAPAKVGSVEWVIGGGGDAAFSDVLAGDLDIADIPEPFDDSVAAVKRTLGEDNIKQLSVPVVVYMGIPAYLEQYTKEHRRALSMAVDRHRYYETTPAAHSVIPAALGGDEHVCDSWSYDPEKARELWNTAGPLDNITVWGFPSGRFISEGVVDSWVETLGIDVGTVTIEENEFGDHYSLLEAADVTGPFALAWQQDYPSPLNFLEPLYASYMIDDPSGTNVTFYTNPDFDDALAAGKAKIAASGQLGSGLADYFAAEHILCEDAQVIPLFFGSFSFVHSDNVSEVHKDAYNRIGYTLIEAENGIVRVHISEPESLVSTDATADLEFVLGALNTGLIQFDPRTNEPSNAHARSITSEDGGETWTIVLKPGWTFHDSTPNDAASYVKAWSYGAANDEWRNIGYAVYGNIVGYDQLNPDTDEG